MDNIDLDLNRITKRRGSDCIKWNQYGPEVIPLSGAEMEFPSPEPIIRALSERLGHRMFGYNREPPELREVIVERLRRLYAWQVQPDALVFLPSVVVGVNMVCHTLGSSGSDVLVQTPVYGPLLRAPTNAGLICNKVPLSRDGSGYYGIDLDAFETAITARTRLFILCNPHNPVARVFEKHELESMAELCLRHGVVICSDEVYNDWVFDGRRHLPIASLSPNISQRAITFFGTSKSHNIPGLRVGVAVVENRELRQQLLAWSADLVPGVNSLEYIAALEAYRSGGTWQRAVLRYIQANRDFLFEYVQTHLPGITLVKPEGTPTGWLDCRQAGIRGRPFEFFLQKAKVALNDGGGYGEEGRGFLRLAFGCPRSMLTDALERMRVALGAMHQS
jgi:cystathionine beta-lyase